MLCRDTSEHACTVYVTNLSLQLAFCMSSIKNTRAPSSGGFSRPLHVVIKSTEEGGVEKSKPKK